MQSMMNSSKRNDILAGSGLFNSNSLHSIYYIDNHIIAIFLLQDSLIAKFSKHSFYSN